MKVEWSWKVLEVDTFDPTDSLMTVQVTLKFYDYSSFWGWLFRRPMVLLEEKTVTDQFLRLEADHWYRIRKGRPEGGVLWSYNEPLGFCDPNWVFLSAESLERGWQKEYAKERLKNRQPVEA